MLCVAAPKPATFEDLCLSIYDCERKISNIEEFPWVDAAGDILQATTPQALADWEWSCIMAYASNAVNVMMNHHQNSKACGRPCVQVPGITNDLRKALRLEKGKTIDNYDIYNRALENTSILTYKYFWWKCIDFDSWCTYMGSFTSKGY